MRGRLRGRKKRGLPRYRYLRGPVMTTRDLPRNPRVSTTWTRSTMAAPGILCMQMLACERAHLEMGTSVQFPACVALAVATETKCLLRPGRRDRGNQVPLPYKMHHGGTYNRTPPTCLHGGAGTGTSQRLAPLHRTPPPEGDDEARCATHALCRVRTSPLHIGGTALKGPMEESDGFETNVFK